MHELDPHPQPAACGHSATSASEVPAAADEPEQDSDKEGGEKSTESSGHSRQVQDKPLEGASAPSPRRPPTAPHPSLPRASPVCTPRDPISHSSPSNCLQKSPRRAPRARKAHTVGIPPSERADTVRQSVCGFAPSPPAPPSAQSPVTTRYLLKKEGEQYKRD